MRLLFFLFILSFSLHAQDRENKPIPKISEDPIGTLNEAIGWSYSIDGQWIEGKNIIPIRTISTNKKYYTKKPNRLGLDNFGTYTLYPVQYGPDTLLLLIKTYTQGYYKYDRIKKGWREQENLFYYIYDYSEQKKLEDIVDLEKQLVQIKLLDDGFIPNIKRNYLEKITQSISINENHKRIMEIAIQPYLDANKVRFQIYSQHRILGDVEGVSNDVKLQGTSIYGTPILLDYLYYEADLDKFSKLLPTSSSFQFDN